MLSHKLTMSAPSEPSVTRSSGAVGAAPASPPASSSDWSTLAKQTRRPKERRWPSNRRIGLIAAAAPMCAVIGLSAGCATSPPATAASPSATPEHPGPGRGAAGGSNARSGPAAGGSVGTVSSLSTSSFTMSTSADQKVTVNEASSTKYQKGTTSTSASSIKTGGSVLVLGTTSGTTITATQVIVQPSAGGSAASPAAKVIPFQRGAPTTSKKIGQIPANYTEGAGTIVSGTTANKATEAALAAYPGGIVDRVVKLSSGEYEAHNIGVNWPHHVFVNQDFKVVGAD
jgi:hypothetical protein